VDEALWPYEKVLRDLRRRIQDGELTGQIPSRLALQAEYDVSHMVVQRAIDILKRKACCTPAAASACTSAKGESGPAAYGMPQCTGGAGVPLAPRITSAAAATTAGRMRRAAQARNVIRSC
jgi:Bacterial regulatory proteins, gntR family